MHIAASIENNGGKISYIYVQLIISHIIFLTNVIVGSHPEHNFFHKLNIFRILNFHELIPLLSSNAHKHCQHNIQNAAKYGPGIHCLKRRITQQKQDYKKFIKLTKL